MLDYFLAFEESFNRFPGLQLRGAGRLPGAGRRPHQVPHLRRSRVKPTTATCRRTSWQQPKKKMNLIQLTFIVAVNMMGSGIIMLPTNMAQGRRDLAAVVDRDGARLDGHRLRLRAGRPLQPAPRRHGRVRRGRLREGGLLPGVLPVLPVARDRQRRDRASPRSATWRRFFPWLVRRRRSPPASA